MCGRYTLAAPPSDLVEAFNLPEPTFEWSSRFNVAPGQFAPVVAEDRHGRRMGLMTWGLIPNWMDEPGRGFINARAESAATKRSFREAFARRRCLVPADGFYEWQRSSDRATKTPFWIHPGAEGVVSFAGLWERWSRSGQAPRHTFTILTTDANEDVRELHDRMPAVIAAADRAKWLDRAASPDALRTLLAPSPRGTFTSYPVSTRVNKPVEDDEGLIEPV
ncbi:MAG: SOS response-associated peptidase [Longimicrobiales bacterium]|nr:SOS response-associated peptidase [Longimicrobiales bacterium]